MRLPSGQLLVALSVAWLTALPGCVPATPAGTTPTAEPITAPPPPAERGPVIRFQYETVGGAPFTSDSVAGRITVIGFIATYDLASQALARFLASLAHRHAPRINVALLVLEQPENTPLVQAFARALNIQFPVAMADAATIAGEGPFAGLHHVPAVVILDRQGREAFVHRGLLDEAQIDGAIRIVEQSGP
jgi:hypothetical protein